MAKTKKPRQLTHEEAAKLGHYCATCRMISYDPDPEEYECARCGCYGYTCCIAGPGELCPNCQREDE